MTEPSDNPPVVSADREPMSEIRPPHWFQPVELGELWRARSLMWAMAVRAVRIRYKQTAVGVLWAVIQPVATIVVFGVMFNWLRSNPTTSDTPYIATAFCAMLPWQLFATSVTLSAQSVTNSQQLIRKVYFPRLILPVAPVFTALIDFSIAFLVLMVVLICYGIFPSWRLIAVVPLLGVSILTALAVGMWVSALNAFYRDLAHAMPFILQIGFLLSPVVYETNAVVPEEYLHWYALNPMVGVLEGFRWALIDAQPPSFVAMGISFSVVLVVLITGAYFFRYMEQSFVDRA